MLIEITPQQQRLLVEIINQAQIRGNLASVIVQLLKAIQTPVKEEEKKDDK